MAVDLYPHQQKAVDQLSNGKILFGDVGTGKSRTAVGYYLQNEAPKDVYVFTTAKKRDSLDWENEFAFGGVFTHARGPLVGKLTVDSWNNIKKYKNVRGAFLVMDEQRLVGNGAWTRAFEYLAKHGNTWILLTATPGDNWLDYMSVFIANGYYKNRTEFTRAHVVYNSYVKFPMVDHYVDTAKLQRLRAKTLVHMPFERHTTRVLHEIPVEYDELALKRVTKERWNPYKDQPIRSLAEYFYIMRKVIYSHESRLDEIRELFKIHKRIIIFYNFDYELEQLRRLAEVVKVAEWNGHKHEEVPDTDEWAYLVQYTAGAEGWNCTTTDTMVFYSLTYSYKAWKQAHGRNDRLNTPYTFLHYYTLMSEAPIDKGVKVSLNGKHDFNQSVFLVKNKGLFSAVKELITAA